MNYCGAFQFLMYSIGNFRGVISEEDKYWRNLIMKIAMRMLVLTLVFSAASFSNISFEGPGTIPPDPPVAAA